MIELLLTQEPASPSQGELPLKIPPEITPGPELTPSPAKVLLRTVVVTGNTAISETELLAVARPYLNNEVAFADLERIADGMTELYRAKGYTLAKVYLAAQGITGGTVQFLILEGRLSEIEITGNQYYQTDFIRRGFAPLLADPVIKHQNLERSVLLLNDYPDLKVKATLAPGNETGTTKVLAQVEDKRPIHAMLDINNFGFVNISRYRFGGTVDIGNAGIPGSVLSLNGIVGDHPDRLSYESLTYKVPLNGWGTKLILNGAMSKFRVGGALSALDLKADIRTYEISVAHPFVKNTFETLLAEAGFASKDNPFDALGERIFDDRLRMLKVGINYDRTDNYGRTFTSLYGFQGLGEFLGGMHDNSPLASHVGADNRFQKATLSAGRVQNLGNDYHLLLRASSQISTGPLPIIEQVLLGGPDTVRAYQLGERFVDEAYTLSGELRVPTMYQSTQLLMFLDHAQGRIRTPQAGQDAGSSLSAAGLGMRMSFPDWYDAAARLDLGFPIHPEQAAGGTLFGGSSPMLYFQITTKY